MTFQDPRMFLWALPIGGLIVLMYLMRMRRRDLKVSATFLWPERQDEIRANHFFQKLKFNWLLVLQLLALALILGGLARWQVRQTGLTGGTTVVVIDASASMGATDVQPSRFDEAKRRLTSLVSGMQGADRLAVIEAGPIPRVIAPLSNDPTRIQAALAGLSRTDAEADVGEALRLATALVGQAEGAKIVLLSDGVFDPIENFTAGKSELLYEQIGKEGKNIAVTAMGTSDDSKGRQLFVGVKNTGGTELPATITISADKRAIFSVQTSLKPGASWGRTVRVPAGVGWLTGEVRARDQLQADNSMTIPANPGKSMRVLLISRGNIFLERALALDSRVTLDRSATVPEGEKRGASEGSSKYDLVVFDGITEVPVKARSVLSFGAAGSPTPVTKTGRLSKPTFLDANAHPILAGVDFGSVYIESGEKVEPRGSGQVIAESNEGPLVVVSEGAQRQVYVAFNPVDSDFPLSIGFPIFLANVLEFLGGTEAASTLAVRTGQVLAVPAASESPLPVTMPDGRVEEIPATAGRYVIRAFSKPGLYKWGSGDSQKFVQANLRSERESATTPVATVEVSGSQVAANQRLDRFADLWKPLALLVLAILALEWWVYARRS